MKFLSMNSIYEIRTSYQTEDQEWDTFVAQVPGGHHLQTSLWGQVKTFSGWSSARVIISEGETIIAGAQLLIKSLPLIGSIAYIPKGPLFSSAEPGLRNLVTTSLFNLINKHRMAYIIIQPPIDDTELSGQLLNYGFQQSKNSVAPTATVILDLSLSLDDILEQMKPKTRYNISIGQRKGVNVREGNENDLSIFHHLMVATGQRNKFPPEPEEYFRLMWKLLYKQGYVRLFLVEYEGEVLSTILIIPFGDTVIYKRGAWSGAHGNLHPNEVMHWEVIKWVKSHGYRFYDLEGIDPRIARSIVHKDSSANNSITGAASFKIGFGGKVTLFPEAYDYLPNPALRYTYTKIFPKMSSALALSGAYQYIRNLFAR